jgi:phosphate:Na+ symporter
MLQFLTILGGIALILHGVRYLRKGLDRLFGDQLGPWLQGVANHPFRAFTGGLGISLLVPSSTSISALAVQSVQSYGISPRQMLILALGADIGLTLTVQLLSMHIEHFGPAFVAIGVALYQYSKSPKSRGVGQVLLSFGFLFMGIGIIQQAASTFDSHGDLARLLMIAEHHPFGMAAIAALFAVTLQSSTATVGLVVALVGSNGLVFPIGSAIAAVVGANVGVGLTTVFMSWPNIDSRRFAVANLIAKSSIGVGVIYSVKWIIPTLDKTPGTLMQHIANVHTAFNVAKAVVFLPLVPALSWLVAKLIQPHDSRKKEIFGPKYINDSTIDSASLALGQSLREILRVSDIVRGMLDDLWRAMRDRDEPLVRQVVENDDQVDLLDREVQRFLAQLGAENLDADQSAEQMRQLRYLTELESVGDVIEKNLCELAIKKMKLGVTFPPEARRELDAFARFVGENMVIADAAFHTRDPLLAQKLLRHKEAINRRASELRDEHFNRMNRRQIDSHEVSALYLDIVGNLRRINSHVVHVAYGILQKQESSSTSLPSLPARLDVEEESILDPVIHEEVKPFRTNRAAV